MEAIIPNFVNAITKVHASLKFGFLPRIIIKSEPKRETATARRGLTDTIVSINSNNSVKKTAQNRRKAHFPSPEEYSLLKPQDVVTCPASKM